VSEKYIAIAAPKVNVNYGKAPIKYSPIFTKTAAPITTALSTILLNY